MEAPDFWDDAEVSQKKMKRIKEHEGRHGNLSESGNPERRYGDLIEMSYEEMIDP